jgi:hypothetical protein
MFDYAYSELRPGYIRLFQLLPSGIDPMIVRCKMFEIHLRASDRARPYEALSYCWGSEKKTHSIIVDAQDNGTSNVQIRVTQNLHAALLHLQDQELPRVFWVDAISIDQSNKAEKENQIQLMAEIFAKASRVIVWLGESQDSSDKALESIRRAATERAAILARDSLICTLMARQRHSSEAVDTLLERPWFRRIWVILRSYVF